LTVALGEQPLWVDGDPIRLAQILTNLLDNAARYTNPGGEIGLSARQDGAAVAVTVRDSGSGIDAAAMPRVFEMFHRGDHERHSGGLGVGLPLARLLVELHGGTIEAHSDGPGRGSAFTVRLPLAPA
jgi:signal transduction histidine kinase